MRLKRRPPSRIPSHGSRSPGVPNTAECLAQTVHGATLTVGPHTYGNPSVISHPGGSLTIGDYCSIAAGVSIWLGGNHRHDWATTYPFLVFSQHWEGASDVEGPDPTSKGPVTIGNDVWIGQNATILSGVTIGDGAVIGAHCVTAKDVAPYAIVVGNPQRQVGRRFDEATIERLLKVRWWSWPEERVNHALPLMLSRDIQAFLTFAEQLGEPNNGQS